MGGLADISSSTIGPTHETDSQNILGSSADNRYSVSQHPTLQGKYD
jgi:hypothetical protein